MYSTSFKNLFRAWHRINMTLSLSFFTLRQPALAAAVLLYSSFPPALPRHAIKIGSFRQTRVTSEATVKGRLHKTVDRKPPTPKAPPEKSPKSSSYNRGGKVGGKGGKFGSAGSKGKADKDKDKDDSKPKVTKARSAYNFYLLKRIAQVRHTSI